MGSARLQVHSYDASFADLAVSRCPQALGAIWGTRLRNAIGLEMEKAQHAGLRLIEAGGWVLAPELRATTEALRIALGGYAMGALLGGALGLCMATFRHHSAGILRRLGASALVWHGLEIPPFYDPVYRCEMQVLRFDSGAPSPKFKKWVDQLQNELKSGTVFCSRLDGGDGESLRTLNRAIYDREYKAAAEYSCNGKSRLVEDKTKQTTDTAPTKGR